MALVGSALRRTPRGCSHRDVTRRRGGPGGDAEGRRLGPRRGAGARGGANRGERRRHVAERYDRRRLLLRRVADRGLAGGMDSGSRTLIA